MGDKKITVIVNASFEKADELFNWLKRYAKHSDSRFVYWDEVAFSVQHLPECDAVLVLNNPSEKIETLCFPENLVAFMMEPGVYSKHPWMFRKLLQYATVYSPIQKSANTILSPGFLGWHVLQDWNALSMLPVPQKTGQVSCIASRLKQFKGHRRRLNFILKLQKEIPAIDFFGKGDHYIPDKMDGLLPYRYSIAIENTSAPYYFTEKIGDCFLSYTVPLYYGCTNIGKFFPERSFIQIDIEDPVQAVKKIKEVVEKNDWEERIPALQEARHLILNTYQPLAGAASVIRKTQPSAKRKIVLNPVPDSLLRKTRNILHDLRSKK